MMKSSEIAIELMVENVDESIYFYEYILGFELLMEEMQDGIREWAKMKHGDFILCFKHDKKYRSEFPLFSDEPIGGTITLIFVVEELEEFYAQVKDKMSMIEHPHLTPCGAFSFSMKDNNGYVLTIERFESQ